MNDTDLTMSEALRDPMIRLMLRADRVPLGEFARLLKKAAEQRNKVATPDGVPSLHRPH